MVWVKLKEHIPCENSTGLFHVRKYLSILLYAQSPGWFTAFTVRNLAKPERESDNYKMLYWSIE